MQAHERVLCNREEGPQHTQGGDEGGLGRPAAHPPQQGFGPRKRHVEESLLPLIIPAVSGSREARIEGVLESSKGMLHWEDSPWPLQVGRIEGFWAVGSESGHFHVAAASLPPHNGWQYLESRHVEFTVGVARTPGG